MDPLDRWDMTSPKTKIPRFPVREWLGRYEAWWLTMYGRKGYRGTYTNLERFFGYFSAYPGLEYFSIADVTDYFEWRRRNGRNPLAVMYEAYGIKKFWKWLTEDKGLPLFNPVRKGLLHKLQRAHTDFVKAKRAGSPETQIQIAPPDVWPTIRDYNYDTSMWDFGVNQD